MITELTQDWGNRLLEDTNKTLCPPGPGRKEQGPHKGLTQACPWVSLGVPGGGVGRQCTAAGLGALSAGLGPLEGGGHYLHFLHLSLVSGQTTGKEYSPTHQQKIGPIRTGPSFPTVGLSQQEASINLLSLSVKGACRMKTTVTGNLSN